MAKKQNQAASAKKARKSRGNRTLTLIFYTVYFVLTIALAAGLFFASTRLEGWLAEYEETSADAASREVFQTYFAEPDWPQLYTLAGIADTSYEDSQAFAAFMSQYSQGKTLSFRETASGIASQRKYQLLLDSDTIGWFTMENRAGKHSRFPNWQFSQVYLNHNRAEDVTILAPEHVTVLVNGIALTDDHVIRIDSIRAQDYLPAGIHAPRTYTHHLSGLMADPQITALDRQGNALEVLWDEEQGVFRIPAESGELSRELYSQCLKTIKAYGHYRANLTRSQDFERYFDAEAPDYSQLLQSKPWLDPALFRSAEWGQEIISGYCRYSDALFSVHGQLPVRVTCTDGSRKDFQVDHSFFFALRDGSWKCVLVTAADVTEPTAFVRVTFRLGDQVIFTNMYSRNTVALPLPILSAPQGQTFAGWFRQEPDADGNLAYVPVFGPGEKDLAVLPEDVPLEPMTLFALFEPVQ